MSGRVLTLPAGRRIMAVELENSLVADNRPRQSGGIFVPSLWRESGSGNARGCPLTVFSSRRQGGLKAFLAAFVNAIVEATMTEELDRQLADLQKIITKIRREIALRKCLKIALAEVLRKGEVYPANVIPFHPHRQDDRE